VLLLLAQCMAQLTRPVRPVLHLWCARRGTPHLDEAISLIIKMHCCDWRDCRDGGLDKTKNEKTT
jgi:hypothetical protein